MLENPEADPGAFWARVDVDLRAGRIRMVFVADVIHPELKRIVEFLNAQMSPAEVVALELRHYAGQRLRTLVPRLIGRTAEAERRKGDSGASAPKATRPSVAEWLARFEAERGAEELAVVIAIRDWWQARGANFGTTRSQAPSLYVQVTQAGHTGYPVFLKASGRVTTGLYAVKKLPPLNREDIRRDIVDALAAATGLVFSERAFDGEPGMSLAALRDPRTRDAVFAVWQVLMDRIRGGT